MNRFRSDDSVSIDCKLLPPPPVDDAELSVEAEGGGIDDHVVVDGDVRVGMGGAMFGVLDEEDDGEDSARGAMLV
jgi:hypothetical protein